MPYGPSEIPQGHTFTLKEQDEQLAYRKRIKWKTVESPFSHYYFLFFGKILLPIITSIENSQRRSYECLCDVSLQINTALHVVFICIICGLHEESQYMLYLVDHWTLPHKKHE